MLHLKIEFSDLPIGWQVHGSMKLADHLAIWVIPTRINQWGQHLCDSLHHASIMLMLAVMSSAHSRMLNWDECANSSFLFQINPISLLSHYNHHIRSTLTSFCSYLRHSLDSDDGRSLLHAHFWCWANGKTSVESQWQSIFLNIIVTCESSSPAILQIQVICRLLSRLVLFYKKIIHRILSILQNFNSFPRTSSP